MTMELELTFNPKISYVMYQNKMKVILGASAVNNGELENGVVFKITSEPKFFSDIACKVDYLQPGEKIEVTELHSFSLKLDPDYIMDLTEKSDSKVKFVAEASDGTVLGSTSVDATVLTFDFWPGVEYPEMVASFVTPNVKSLVHIRSRASDILKSWGKSPSLEGYQSEDRDRILAFGAAMYASFEKENLNYVNPPASFEKKGQRIRLPDEVLANHEGTCIDLAAMYASALESMGLNTVIFIVKGHAFAGFWLVDYYGTDIINWDSAAYTRAIRNNEFRAVECTSFLNASEISFEEACNMALVRLEDSNNFICGVDIRKARDSIVPLPIRNKIDGKWVIERSEEKQATTAPGSVGEFRIVSESKPLTRVDKWKRELLDITNRNNMVNMKQGTRVLPLLLRNISRFEDGLADGMEYTVFPKPQEWEGTKQYSEKPFEAENYIKETDTMFDSEMGIRRIRAPLSDTEMEKSLRSIYRLYKKELEESGCNSLFIALGVLRWYEGRSTGVPHYAPLILLPVELKKKQSSYSLRRLDEETVFNVTLAEKLRQEFEIELPNMDPLPMDESGVDVDSILNTVRDAIAGKEGWDVLYGASLGVFSFSQFVMWKDIDSNIESFRESEVVSSLIDGTPYPADKEIEASADPYGLCLTVPADGSQIKAVRAAGDGKTFVMHGPPGTGKSQTITNMITNALSQGKTVLFVAEKRAALEVVQKRLDGVGVGNHCLELHSNKTEKSKVIEQLKLSLSKASSVDERKAEELIATISNVCKKLDCYVNDLHRVRSFGMSAYEAISMYESNDVPGTVEVRVDPNSIRTINRADFVDMEDAVRNARTAYLHVEGADEKTLCHVRRKEVVPSVGEDTVERINNAYSKAENYEKAVEAAKAIGLPIDVTDPVARDAFFRDVKAIDENVIADPSIEEMSKGLKEVCDNAFSITRIMSDYSSAGINIPSSNLQLTLDKISVLENSVNAAISKGHVSSSTPLIKMIADCKEFCFVLMRNENNIWLIRERWNDNVFKLDSRYNLTRKWSEANSAGLFSKGKMKKEFLTTVSSCLRNPNAKFEELGATADLVSGMSADLLKAESYPMEYASNTTIKAEINSLRNKAVMADRAIRLSNVYNIPVKDLPGLSRKVEGAKSVLIPLENAQKEWKASVNSLTSYLDCDLDLLPIADCRSFCESLKPSIDMLFDWVNWNSYADRLSSKGLSSMIPSVKSDLDIELLVHSMFKSISKTFINICRTESDSLSMFNSSNFEEMIKKYKATDDEYTRLNRNLLKYKLYQKVPKNMDSNVKGSETGILYRAINGSRIGKSIRQLLSEIPNVLPRICPCLLMSPQSVPQYITTAFPKFDLVIFDESSQITTSKAIGSLGRAKCAVIAGDSKQLPPTMFFQKKIEASEDDDDQIDIDSFLDDCLALNMPETYLEWHYRSRHESLITFSNRMFYNSKMLTFPSPNDQETKVSMRFIGNGRYERGKSVNTIEAKAIVDEVYRRVMDKELSKQSIGIVAFSMSQQTCIQDMLDDRSGKDSAFFTRLNAAQDQEDIFVKNLETVQGDERDVIMFSIGYGPDSNGNVYQNFGPINREGGGRRLNVAVSRARMEMIVFTSMKYTDVKLTSSSSKGLISLREFLRFAENNGRFPDCESSSCRCDGTQILTDIAKTLGEKGYQCRFNVGTSSFKVDIGIVDPDYPDKYILGLLSDGDSYKSSENTRDREYARADVLNRLGWNLMHVWSVDWHFNKNKTLDHIVKELEWLRKNRDAPVVEEPVPEVQEQEIPEDVAVEERVEEEHCSRSLEYTLTAFESIEMDPEIAVKSQKVIEQYAKPIIDAESPINETYLVKLYCRSVGIKRLTEQKRVPLVNNLRGMYHPDVEGKFVTYWADGAEKGIDTYRVSSDSEINRPIDCIPLVELRNACEDTVERCISLKKEDASAAVSRNLGYKRMGAAIKDMMNEIIEMEIASGKITESNGLLSINEYDV